MIEMGEAGLDDLINTMVRITEEYRVVMKSAGWIEHREDEAD
jgi:hypothetical protein